MAKRFRDLVLYTVSWRRPIEVPEEESTETKLADDLYLRLGPTFPGNAEVVTNLSACIGNGIAFDFPGDFLEKMKDYKPVSFTVTVNPERE